MTNFGLFQRSGLEQYSGNIQERWGQEGSTIINFASEDNVDATLYTVTSGKTLYVSTLIITNITAGAGTGKIRDGGSGGAIILYFDFAANGDSIAVPLKSPLKFDTDVYLDLDGSSETHISVAGWEEV